MDGTSQSTGFVSGVVARILQQTTTFSSEDMLQFLQNTATRNRTNAETFNTVDMIVYSSCDSGTVFMNHTAWPRWECYDFVTTEEPPATGPTGTPRPTLPEPRQCAFDEIDTCEIYIIVIGSIILIGLPFGIGCYIFRFKAACQCRCFAGQSNNSSWCKRSCQCCCFKCRVHPDDNENTPSTINADEKPK